MPTSSCPSRLHGVRTRLHRGPLTLVAALLALPFAAPHAAHADDAAAPEVAKPPQIGEQPGPVRFVDTRYLPRTLDELRPAKAVVVFFTTVECPLVLRYLPRVVELERAHAAQGVRFLALNVGPGDTLLDVATQEIESGAAFPFAKDFDGSAAAALGVARTATAVVLDGEGRIAYRGRVDDQYRFGGVRPARTRDDLGEALADVLAGRAVRVAETPVDGCAITATTPPPAARAPTYCADVAPLLERHCVECHRPGTEAPFPLDSYAKAADNAEMLLEVVEQGRMPPWFASPRYGEFQNHRGLTAAEIGTLRAWVAAGCPEGDRAQLAPPRTWPEPGWEIGEPDLLLDAPEEVSLPAHGYVAYKYALLPYRFPRDTWIGGIQIRPRNRRVLHHANLAYLLPTEGMSEAHFITGQVPGGSSMALDPGYAVLIPKDALLVLQMHYVTTGEPQTDRITVGIRYPRWRVQKQIQHLKITDRHFQIPPGAPAHEVHAARALPCEAEPLALFAHMHLRGRDMRFSARTPDGKVETLLLVPNYSFDWQLAYRYGPGRATLPKGTRIECVGHFDNSAFNPYNPDPKATVRFGEQTYHEMFYGFFYFTDADEHLDLDVDPKTGAALPPAAAAPTPPAERRFFQLR